MYQKSPQIIEPEDKNAKIWRYMDFTKFVSVLDQSALFFPTIELLKKTDPFEGTYTKANMEYINKLTIEDIDPDIISEKLFPWYKQINSEELLQTPKSLQKYILVNCWHSNENENLAMWNSYIKTNEGIAIQSTFQRLIDCFVLNEDEIQIYVGKVNYIDYATEFIPVGELFSLNMHKRKSFSFESEIRAITLAGMLMLPPFGSSQKIPKILENIKQQNGVYFPINLGILVERVYVSPSAADWYYDLVKSIVNKYNLDVEVKRSDLDDDPLE